MLFVAASTHCFPDVTINKSLQRLADLDFNASEIVVGYATNELRPEWLVQDFQAVCRLCLPSRQISPVAFLFNVPSDDPKYFQKFIQCLRLCKVLGVVTVAIKASPVGTPYNEEFERLVKLVKTGEMHGVIVSLLTEQGAISSSVDSLESLCKGIPNLRVALDPSCFIYGYSVPINFDSILCYVSHVRLRDTTTKKFQVKIGQGKLEYNKLVGQLKKYKFSRALCVDIVPLPHLDIESELRKMRLLVESLL